jgi:hypothetical protein
MDDPNTFNIAYVHDRIPVDEFFILGGISQGAIFVDNGSWAPHRSHLAVLQER